MELDGFGATVRLGAGGVGDVYRAIRLSTGAPVAIKVLRDWSDSSSAWRRAQRELRALVQLQGHPNVVHVEEVIEVDGVPHLVMEYAPGGSVTDLFRDRGGPLDVGEVVLIGEHTSSALAASHGHGIIHLDIKPQNLLIGAFGQVKVCDFGIAALTHTEQFRERTSSISYRYASPEQLDDDGETGPAADVFSLGATLIHLLTGRSLPLRASDTTVAKVPFQWESPDDIAPETADRLVALLTRCVRYDPDSRPTAAEAHAEFESIAATLGARRCRALVSSAATVSPPPASRDFPTVQRTRPRSNAAAPPPPPPLQPLQPAPPPPTNRAGAAPIRRRVAVLGAAAATLVAVAVGATIVLSGGSDDDASNAPASSAELVADTDAEAPSTSPQTASPATAPPTIAVEIVATTVLAAPVATVVDSTTTVTTAPPSTTAAVRVPNPVPAITSASASLVRSDSTDACGNPTSYQPAFSVDGVNSTAWMAPGDGIGATLTVVLTGPSIVSRVGLIPGYDKFDPCTGSDRFFDLRRVTAVRWTFDDGTVLDHIVEPAPGMQVLDLVTPVTTETVTMTILSTIEPGDARLDHTPVSEVIVQ